MNQVMENILTRRSVRVFKSEQISDVDLNTILEAATFAPSGMNVQSWHFTVVQNNDKLVELNSLVKEVILKYADDPSKPVINGMRKMAENPNFNFFYNAPTFVIVTNSKTSASPVSDCALALQNIFLAAHSLQISSCWIHALVWLNGLPEIRSLLTEFGVPEGHDVFGCAALGFNGGNEPKPSPRKLGTVNILK